MNKQELIDAIAVDAALSKMDAGRAIDAFVNTVSGCLSKGEPIVLVGFGTFDIGKRAARDGRNPRTGQKIRIPAAKVPRFRAGKGLKDTVNGN